MNPQNFVEQFPSVAVSVAIQPNSDSAPCGETVKLSAVGSLAGIDVIRYSLHAKQFAEVNQWGYPQPTGKPGEYISVLFKRVWL